MKRRYDEVFISSEFNSYSIRLVVLQISPYPQGWIFLCRFCVLGYRLFALHCRTVSYLCSGCERGHISVSWGARLCEGYLLLWVPSGAHNYIQQLKPSSERTQGFLRKPSLLLYIWRPKCYRTCRVAPRLPRCGYRRHDKDGAVCERRQGNSGLGGLPCILRAARRRVP